MSKKENLDPTPESIIGVELSLIKRTVENMEALERVAYTRMLEAGFWKRRHRIINVMNIHSLEEATEGEGRRIVLMEALALITSEIGEAVEGVRKDAKDEHLPQYESVSVELADAIIRILDLSGGLGLNVPGAIRDKMEFNRTAREKMHGKLS